MGFFDGLSGLASSVWDFGKGAIGANPGYTPSNAGAFNTGVDFSRDALGTIGSGVSGLASYLTPANVNMAAAGLDTYNKYDMNKSYKKNMEADMANQQRLTDASIKAQNWNLQQAKDAEEDKDQFQANAISGFGKAFG